MVRPLNAAIESSTNPDSFSVSVWMVTCTSSPSAAVRQHSMAAGVVPQSSCSFSPTAPHPRRDTRHHVGVAGLADADDAAGAHADVGFVNSAEIDNQCICDHQVERVGGAGHLAHPLAQHFAAAELALVAVDGVVAL